MLSLSSNQISDITVLSGLTSLLILALQNNQISDISALSGFTNLMWLCLVNNPLNVEAYSTYLPLIEDNNPGIDLCIDVDGDGVLAYDDNCPNTPNPNQADTYPPGGNGVGDACECEADFDCNGNVDAVDASNFLLDFGRGAYYDPCTNDWWCYGDFDCNGSVDAEDVSKLLEDYGRGQYSNPCPACEAGNWCNY
jgi:hypothetical protein